MSPPRELVRQRRTKIVATIGPASSSPEMLAALIEAGMDGARLNMSHGTRAEHAERARRIREAEEAAGRPIALIADLQGPKLRVGDLDAAHAADPRLASWSSQARTMRATATCRSRPRWSARCSDPAPTSSSTTAVCSLLVERVEGGRASCRVVVGGQVTSHKGVNLPGVTIPVPSLTDEGPRGPRMGDRDRRRLRRALLRALRRGRPGAEALPAGARVAGMGDRQDREDRGGRRARGDPRGDRRRDGRARRPRRRDRRGRGAAAAEADHPPGAARAVRR